MASELSAFADKISQRDGFTESVEPKLRDERHNERYRIELAKSILRFRRRRYFYIDASLLGERSWDILLYLYIAQSNKKISLTAEIAKAIGAPVTTSLRYYDDLEKNGYLYRSKNRRDRRSTIITMTTHGVSTMQNILDDWKPWQPNSKSFAEISRSDDGPSEE
jgi:DNA-binding MarR family transcriptional regulator